MDDKSLINYNVFFANDISKEMEVETFYGEDLDLPLDVLADIDVDDLNNSEFDSLSNDDDDE
jgi:hypothetical protein